MVKCVAWLFWIYLTLKLVQAAFGGRAAGWTAAPTLRQRLVRGEPILFAIAFALAVPAALASNWYVHRGHVRALEHASDCYGRLRAIDRLPDMRWRFDAYEVFRVTEAAELVAAMDARALELEPGAAGRLLAGKMRLHAARYAALARSGDPRARADEQAAIARCLREPLVNI